MDKRKCKIRAKYRHIDNNKCAFFQQMRLSKRHGSISETMARNFLHPRAFPSMLSGLFVGFITLSLTEKKVTGREISPCAVWRYFQNIKMHRKKIRLNDDENT